MSGHSKWAQIKRQKASEDQKRSKLFSVLGRQLALEARKANGDRSLPGLRRAIEKAKENNMPGDTIERSIKAALGQGGTNYEEVTYEAYGPGGAALILEGITDNKNRTSQEIKHLLSKHNSSLATPGAVTWAFQKIDGGWQATTPLELSEVDTQALANLLDELETNEDIKTITTNVPGF